MDRRAKATLNRDKARRLNDDWGVGAAQVRYSDDGHWYATLEQFPAALFDAHGYVLFATEADYRGSPHLRLGKQISVPRPGISAIPGYVRLADPTDSAGPDVDVHTVEASEGRRRLVQHLRRERNRTLVRAKKRAAASLACEVCGFSFGAAYGAAAADYCEVHHLLPFSAVEEATITRLEDLAIVCANCHRVIHLQNPPYTLEQARGMLAARPAPAPAVRQAPVRAGAA